MKKRVLSIALCAALAATLFAGCNNNSSNNNASTAGGSDAAATDEAPSGDLPILGAGIYASTDNFNSYIGKGITKYSNGVFAVNVDDGQNDQSTQLNQIDTALAKGAVAIAVSVVDVTVAPTIVTKCQEAGDVPVIFFNKEITDKDVVNSYDLLYQVTSTGGDYGAAIQGQMVVDYWKAHPEMDKNGDGKLQMINLMGDPAHTAAPPRAQFVKSTIEDAGIEIDLLEEDTGMWDTAKAKEKMDAWISKHGDDIELIVAANDAMALGALQSVEAAGFNQEGFDSELYIPIIGIDALPEVLDKISSGEMVGSVLQDAQTQGMVIVAIAKNLSEGKDALDGLDFELDTDGSKAVRVPYAPITLENVAEAAAGYAE